MKKLGIVILLIISSLSVKAHFKNDTTIVEFTDRGTKKRVAVYTNGMRDFKIPSQLNLENLLREIGVDSSERRKAIVLISQNGDKKDTVLAITHDGRKIKIVTNEPKGVYRDSKEYKNDTLRREEPETHGNHSWNYDYNQPKRDRSYDRFFSRNDFSLYLGLNNWFSKNSAIPAPTLSPLGSRYVALSWRRNVTIISGKKADFAFSYSPEILWYNFMFNDNTYATTSNKQVQFTDYPNSKALSISKLVVPTINLPIMLNIGFKESRFQFGVGGYIGYRVDSYTKVKFESGGKEWHHESFQLNDVRYGLTAEMGRKNGLKLFFRYDLNEMFKTDQVNAPHVQGWSVGLRFL